MSNRLTISLEAAAALEKGRAVLVSGSSQTSTITSGSQAAYVAYDSAASGSEVGVTMSGYAKVQCGDAAADIVPGTEVMFDENGRAVAISGSHSAVGVALENAVTAVGSDYAFISINLYNSAK